MPNDAFLRHTCNNNINNEKWIIHTYLRKEPVLYRLQFESCVCVYVCVYAFMCVCVAKPVAVELRCHATALIIYYNYYLL